MNKMFKKLMAVSATVAIAATMSVSAFAADVTVAPTDGAVTVTPTAVENATMYTVMVFSCAADADIAKATPADATAIYYINQGADVNALVSNMLVKATSETEYLPAGNYVVRIGNDKGSVQNFSLVSEVADTGVTVKWGDITGDGEIDSSDAIAAYLKLAKKDVSYTDATDPTVVIPLGASVELTVDGKVITAKFGDITGDGEIDSSDAIAAYLKLAKKDVSWTTNVDGTDYTISLGETIKVKIVK